MILLQFFALMCVVVAMVVIGAVVNIVVNFLYLRRKLAQGAKQKFGARRNKNNMRDGAANGAKSSAANATTRKKIIPDDEGEYVDFVEL